MGGVMNDDSLSSLIWSLTRLQSQCEAVIAALNKIHPGIDALVSAELKNQRESGRILEIGAEVKREFDAVKDWKWLKSQGIDPNS
jgi:hypothetical protein